MKIAFLGDIALFGRFSTATCSIEDLFRKLSDVKILLSAYDIIIANLETPLTECTRTCGGKSAYIKGMPSDSEILKFIGITHVTLANNHIFDFTKEGLEDTINALEKVDIQYLGIDNKTCYIVDGKNKLHLHGYCCYSTNGRGLAEDGVSGVNVLDYDAVKKELEEDKQKGYLSILSMHWGQEHVNYPNYYHVEFVRSLAKNYTFILHGHHPHVMQGIERISDAIIAYSLGNFIFDDVYTRKSQQPLVKLSENNKETFILAMEIVENKVIRTNYIPIYIGNKHLEITGIEEFKEKMREYSASLQLNKNEYINKRQILLNNYINSRKKLRNLKWYVKRLNLDTVKMLYYAKINEHFFYDHIIKKIPTVNIRNSVLLLGNFDVINKNAAGRRVEGVALILKGLGLTPVLAGVNKNFMGQQTNDCFITEDGFRCYALKTSLSTMDWLRVNSTYNFYLGIIRKIGIRNIRCIYVYGSPVLSIVIQRLITFATDNDICIIGDCVDWIEYTSGGMLRNIVKYIDTNYQKRFLYGKMSGMIVISRYLQKYYVAKGIPTLLLPPVGKFENIDKKVNNSANIHIVYAGIPFPCIPNIKSEFMKDRLDKIIEIILHINRHGFSVILDIYGVTKEHYLNAVPQHRKAITDNSIINFYGLVDNVTVKQAIANAAATILIRDKNLVTTAGFPTKVAESLCLGTPVIVNVTSDIDLYVQDGCNGILIDDNIENSSKKICEKFLNENKYSELKNNCRRTCNFDYEKFISELGRFLNNIRL